MPALRLLKLNGSGIAHFVLPLIVVVLIAAVGTYLIVGSKAATGGTKTVGKVYMIKQKYQKTSGGVGVWIANASNGYVQGRAFPGDHVQVAKNQWSCQDGVKTKCENWVYGLIVSHAYNGVRRTEGPVYTYGWLKARNLQKTKVNIYTDTSHILAQEKKLYDRNSLGGSFNCEKHVCIGGKRVKMVAGCDTDMFYNAVIKDGRLVAYDRAGRAPDRGIFSYRYTTAYQTAGGNYFALGRDTRKPSNGGVGWVFIDDKCIPKGTKRLGGPQKVTAESFQALSLLGKITIK